MAAILKEWRICFSYKLSISFLEITFILLFQSLYSASSAANCCNCFSVKSEKYFRMIFMKFYSLLLLNLFSADEWNATQRSLTGVTAACTKIKITSNFSPVFSTVQEQIKDNKNSSR